MKKSIVVLVILLSALSLTLSSCSSDDNDSSSDPKIETGSFEIYLDGTLLKATNAQVGLTKDDQGNYVNTVTIGKGTEIAIVVSGFPRIVGDVATMAFTSDPGVNIVSGKVFYNTRSGTLTRTSASKISFNGTYTNFPDTQEYTITGYVESKAWEIID